MKDETGGLGDDGGQDEISQRLVCHWESATGLYERDVEHSQGVKSGRAMCWWRREKKTRTRDVVRWTGFPRKAWMGMGMGWETGSGR
jgi:hypothetical protein